MEPGAAADEPRREHRRDPGGRRPQLHDARPSCCSSAPGPTSTSVDVAKLWLDYLPPGRIFTAERVAMRNLLEGYLPPETATRHNPFREWIGARLRVDVYGWARSGDPSRAARMACEDARLSHTANGVYAAMWMAAAHAASLWANDRRRVRRRRARRRPAAEPARRGAALRARARRRVGGSRRRALRALRRTTTGCTRSTTPRSSRRRSTPSTTSRRRSAASSRAAWTPTRTARPSARSSARCGPIERALVGAAARPLLELAARLRRRSRSTSSPRVRSRSHDASTRSSRGRSTGRRRSTVELDSAKIIAAPDDPADWPAWRDALARWRDEARARGYDGSAYERLDVDAELLLRRARLALGRAALRPRGAAVHARAAARRGRSASSAATTPSCSGTRIR